jgi:acyl carrier protein
MEAEDRIRNVMAAVFDVPATEITDDASPHDIKGWDSLKHMNLVLALEDEFDVHFDEAEIPSLVNFRIIAATIRAYAE